MVQGGVHDFISYRRNCKCHYEVLKCFHSVMLLLCSAQNLALVLNASEVPCLLRSFDQVQGHERTKVKSHLTEQQGNVSRHKGKLWFRV